MTGGRQCNNVFDKRYMGRGVAPYQMNELPSSPMAGTEGIDREARRELLAHAVAQSVGSGPALVVASAIVAVLAAWNGRVLPALSMMGAMALLWYWRWRISRRVADRAYCMAHLSALKSTFRINMACTGFVWVFALVFIFPYLHPAQMVLMLLIVVGAMMVALPVCSMVEGALEWYALPQPLAAGIVGYLHGFIDIPMVIATIGVFTFVMLRTARQYQTLGRDAVLRRLMSEAANDALRDANAQVARTNAELQSAMDSAQAAAVAKTRFLANMSHEIRTPINGVLGALELLDRHPLSNHVRDLVGIAGASARALLKVLNEVLDYADIDMRQPALRSEPVLVRDLLESMQALFRASALAKGVSLQLEVHPVVPQTILGDAMCLRQILMNLIGNAVKFTPAGMVRLRADLDTQRSDRLVIEIVDTGIGIAETDQARLFTPFFQADSSDARAYGGAGLGLAFSKRMVDAMGGQLTIRSALGQGTTVRMALPLTQGASDAAPAPGTQTVPAQAAVDPAEWRHAGTRVLLVEDNEVNRLVAREMLATLGLSVTEAINGKEALDSHVRAPATLVLMDCQMPEMDGFEATRLIREQERLGRVPHVPIIAVTAHVLESDAERCRAAGMDDFLAKPYALADLQATLERWIVPR